MGWVVNATPLQLYPPGKVPGTHFIGGWVGPIVGLDGCGKSAPRLDPQTVLPVESMYRLSYRGHHAVLKVPFNKPTVSAVSRCHLPRTSSLHGQDISLFSKTSRPALGRTQSLIFSGYRGCFRGGWSYPPPHLLPGLRFGGAIHLLPPFAFVTWRGTASHSG